MAATIRLGTEAAPGWRTGQHSRNSFNLTPWKLGLRALLLRDCPAFAKGGACGTSVKPKSGSENSDGGEAHPRGR